MYIIWGETKDECKTLVQTHHNTMRTTKAQNKLGLVKNVKDKQEWESNLFMAVFEPRIMNRKDTHSLFGLV